MEKKKVPFSVHAARWSVILPICMFFLNLAMSHSQRHWERHEIFIEGTIRLALHVGGIVLAILALRGIKIHGPQRIRGFAVTGLILNSIILILMLSLIPVMMRVKTAFSKDVSESQMNAFMATLKEDVNQIQTKGTVPVRTFSDEQYGSLTPILYLVNDNMVSQMRASQEFNRKTGHIDIGSYLEATRLIDPNSIAFSRENVLILQKSYQELLLTIKEQTNTSLKKLNDLDMSLEIKRGFFEGYMDSKIRESKYLEEMKLAHFNYTQAIINLLSFMETKTKVCSVEEDCIVFDQDADCDQFNELFTRMVGLETQLLNLAEQSQQYIQKTIDEMP